MIKIIKAALLTQSILFAGALSANDYLMSQEGDEKTFSTRNTESVVKIVDTYNGNWKRYSTFLGKANQWLWSSETNQEVYWLDSNNKYQLLVDFADSVGSSYEVNIDTCTTKAIIAEKNVSLFVDAGRFENTVRLSFEGPCADGGLLDAVFAPGVGLVSYTEQSIAGPVKTEIVSGNVDGVVYPLFTGIEMRAEFPAGTVLSNVQDKVSAYITLSNNSNRAETFVFPSSQLFAIVIFDAKGEEVNRWSANKRFMMAIQEVEIAAGSEERFGGVIELRNLNGQTLDVGSYRIRIELKGSNKPVASVFTAIPFSAESPLYIDQRISLDF